jgi:hypothetical protein
MAILIRFARNKTLSNRHRATRAKEFSTMTEIAIAPSAAERIHEDMFDCISEPMTGSFGPVRNHKIPWQAPGGCRADQQCCRGVGWLR